MASLEKISVAARATTIGNFLEFLLLLCIYPQLQKQCDAHQGITSKKASKYSCGFQSNSIAYHHVLPTLILLNSVRHMVTSCQSNGGCSITFVLGLPGIPISLSVAESYSFFKSSLSVESLIDLC